MIVKRFDTQFGTVQCAILLFDSATQQQTLHNLGFDIDYTVSCQVYFTLLCPPIDPTKGCCDLSASFSSSVMISPNAHSIQCHWELKLPRDQSHCFTEFAHVPSTTSRFQLFTHTLPNCFCLIII